jgi:hypothetical protein
MPHIFKPAANTTAKLSLILGAAIPVLTFVMGSAVSRSSSNTKQNVPLNQPVPFSHKHHALELGIDCRFCHSTVETTAKAGVPATEVCMTCHSMSLAPWWPSGPALKTW